MSALRASVQFRLRLCHRITVLNGGTDEQLPGVRAELVPPAWPYWRLHRRGAHILLSAYEPRAGERPAQTTVRVRVTNPTVAARLEAGGVAEVDVASGDPVVTHAIAPLDHAVEIRLVDEAQDPVAGRTVQVRASQGSASVAAPEDQPGVYRTVARQWGAAFRPARIVVDGTPQDRRVTPDWRADITSVQLIIPT